MVGISFIELIGSFFWNVINICKLNNRCIILIVECDLVNVEEFDKI